MKLGKKFKDKIRKIDKKNALLRKKSNALAKLIFKLNKHVTNVSFTVISETGQVSGFNFLRGRKI